MAPTIRPTLRGLAACRSGAARHNRYSRHMQHGLIDLLLSPSADVSRPRYVDEVTEWFEDVVADLDRKRISMFD